MEMATVWRLIDTCIIPIITYAAETWTIPQKESKQIQQIMDNVLRRIMKTPVTTPTEIIQAETGIMDIESIRAQKQVLYYHRIMNTKGNDTLKMLLNTGKNPWKILLDTTLARTNIDQEKLLEMNKKQAKNYVKKHIREHHAQKILAAANEKSKLRDLIIYRVQEDLKRRPKYITILNRTECSHIFQTRARMMKVKANYKNQFADLKCRWCNDQNETQQHILTRCPEFKQITQDTTYYDTYFQNTNKSYYKAANILGKVYTKIADMTEQNRENTANG
jgi:phage FluMu protein Com/uncharacterized protein YggT (Ycf19 family)